MLDICVYLHAYVYTETGLYKMWAQVVIEYMMSSSMLREVKTNTFSMFDAVVCKARSHLSHTEQPENSRNIFSLYILWCFPPISRPQASGDSANFAVKRVPCEAVWEFSVKDGFKAFDKDST